MPSVAPLFILQGLMRMYSESGEAKPAPRAEPRGRAVKHLTADAEQAPSRHKTTLAAGLLLGGFACAGRCYVYGSQYIVYTDDIPTPYVWHDVWSKSQKSKDLKLI